MSARLAAPSGPQRRAANVRPCPEPDGRARPDLFAIAMYENKTTPPLKRTAFAKRVLMHLAGVFVLLLGSLAIGMGGYAALEHLSWVDAFLNAAMLLGGMGPVNTPTSVAGKLFAGTYALYAGLVFIVSAALVFTPIAHRILHKFHWDEGL